MPVFSDLFDEEGSEIYMRSLGLYGLRGGQYEWAQLQEAARERGDLLLGYIRADSNEASLHVPRKSEMLLNEGDSLVVLATS